jgi:hypothetical protein
VLTWRKPCRMSTQQTYPGLHAHHSVADGLKLCCLERPSQERGVLLDGDGVVGLKILLLLSEPFLLRGSALVGVSLWAATADGMLLLLHAGPKSAKPCLTAKLSPLCDVAARKLATGNLTAGNLAARKVGAGKLTTSRILADGELATGKLAVGKLAIGKSAARKLAARELAAWKLATRELAAGKLATEKLTAGKLAAAGMLAAGKLAAGMSLLTEPSLLWRSFLLGVSLRAADAKGLLLLLHEWPKSAKTCQGLLLLLLLLSKCEDVGLLQLLLLRFLLRLLLPLRRLLRLLLLLLLLLLLTATVLDRRRDDWGSNNAIHWRRR